MAWNAKTTETITTPTRMWQVVLGGYGDQSVNRQLLDLSSRETRDIYSVELLEIRYKPAASEVGDNSLVRLAWNDDTRLNDDNRHYRVLGPVRQSDGSFIGEYNIPRVLYKFDGTNHRPYGQSFDLSLYRELTQSKLATDFILLTLRVTARHIAGMEYHGKFEPTILNALT